METGAMRSENPWERRELLAGRKRIKRRRWWERSCLRRVSRRSQAWRVESQKGGEVVRVEQPTIRFGWRATQFQSSSQALICIYCFISPRKRRLMAEHFNFSLSCTLEDDVYKSRRRDAQTGHPPACRQASICCRSSSHAETARRRLKALLHSHAPTDLFYGQWARSGRVSLSYFKVRIGLLQKDYTPKRSTTTQRVI
ncbi:uncharacterized protein BJX67DRAFT_312726 [Aspergillus lucknowensis]|uniref:Uncharacterized protein n=1 Tax=Aspergillus lucknowensis TaxID=176173 RepID=A0ABR4L9Q7_9EURO